MTVEQYEARLGRTLTGAERAQAEALLADASDVVRRIAQGRLDEATSEDVPGPIRMVIFSMVTRAVRNPAGVNSERIADYQDRKSTRLNSSHVRISYAVFCLKKKKKEMKVRYS